MRPKKPIGPKGVGTGQRSRGQPGRKFGAKIVYDPDQLQRYRSQWVRYQRSLDIQPDGAYKDGAPMTDADLTVLRANGAGTGTYTFRFSSKQSPIGYWEATFNSVDDPNGGGGAGSNQYTLITPCSQTPWTPFPATEQYQDVKLLIQGSGRFKLVSGTSSTSETLTVLPGLYDFPGGTALRFEPLLGPGTQQIQVWFDYPDGSSNNNFGEIYFVSSGANGYLFERSYQVFFSFTSNGVPVTPVTPAPGGGSCPPLYDPPPDPLPPDPGPDPEPTTPVFRCNCPDFSKLEGKDIASPHLSRQTDRDWRSSNAGANGDCKHTYSSKTYCGVAFQIPSDPAI